MSNMNDIWSIFQNILWPLLKFSKLVYLGQRSKSHPSTNAMVLSHGACMQNMIALQTIIRRI